MPADLDAALLPGETIVYRSSGRSIAGPCIIYGTVLLSFSVLLLLLGAGGFAGLDKFGAVVGLGVALLIFLLWQRRKPDQLIVTDRRVLFADGDWDDKSAALSLEEIEGFTWSTDRWGRELFVAGAGQTIRLSDFRDIDAATNAIANAADLQAPPPLGALTAVNLPELGGLVATCLILPVLRLGLDTLIVMLPAEPFGIGGVLFDLAIVLTLLAIAFPLGRLSGGLVIASALRAMLSAEQMQAALCCGKSDSLPLRIGLKWAGLLYGRRMTFSFR